MAVAALVGCSWCVDYGYFHAHNEGLDEAKAVLETLGPAERAVFVLRGGFETPYGEIAEAVGKSPAAVRQIAHRARDHVGDPQGLLDVLAPDVVIVADGGGLGAAARRPIEGAERVAAVLILASRSTDFEAKAVWLNGAPAGRIDIGGEVNTAVSP